jgi:formylglycine-generating enzyme required for sulfatase activity
MVTVDDFNNATTQSLPPDFPKGFAAFYCMKYEMSQQNYIDFFNTLNNTQKATRDITGTSSAKNTDALLFRNNISWTSGDATLNGGTYGDVACNFIRWGDGAAFADWACLRPMSELEYEKACRGTENAVPNELAWGNTTPTLATGISNIGNNDEVASNTDANVNLGSITGGPLRVGSFATSTADRIKAGATFYGIMEMSGNLHERTVSVGRSQGRLFTRSIHGNGLLGTTGN